MEVTINLPEDVLDYLSACDLEVWGVTRDSINGKWNVLVYDPRNNRVDPIGMYWQVDGLTVTIK